MNKIDLRRIDLNLLVILDILIQEGSVSRTADRLGRTQSALSHSLKRLREQLDDPLLVKIGGRMQPSLYAQELVENIRPILRNLQRTLSPRADFDPATSSRTFRIALPDFTLYLFPRLFALIRHEAPNVVLEWVTPKESVLLDLAEGQIDMAVAPEWLSRPDGVGIASVGNLRWACFGRRGHPAFSHWSKRQWAKCPQLVAGASDQLRTPVSDAAAAAGLKRITGASISHFSAVAPMLAKTDLIATLPAIVLADALKTFDLTAVRAPFSIEPMPHVLIWSSRHAQDPAIRWLRRHIEQAMSEIVESAHALVAKL